MCNVSPLVPTRLDSAQFPSFSMITEYHHDRRGVIIAAKSPTTQTMEGVESMVQLLLRLWFFVSHRDFVVGLCVVI